MHQTKKSVNPTVSRSSRYWRNPHIQKMIQLTPQREHFNKSNMCSLVNANFRREVICLNALIITFYNSFALSFVLFYN